MNDFMTKVDAMLADYTRTEATVSNALKITYTHPKTRRAIVILRVTGAKVNAHVFAEHLADYMDFVTALPEKTRKRFVTGADCGKREGMSSCEPWGAKTCIGGYTFILDGELLAKCRYNNFKFNIDADNAGDVIQLITRELAAQTE